MEIVRLHLSVIHSLNHIPVHGFVIKHPSVGAILVDTGVGYPEELVKEWKVVNRHVADALAEHDLSPADVNIVVNTHLHFDHCGQNAVFKHAPFYVQRAELDRARKEHNITKIAEGVRAVATPGHTVGHQSVIVESDEGDAVMIGDAAYTARIYEEGDQADLRPWTGQYSDRESWSRSLSAQHDMHPHTVHFCHDTRVAGQHS